MIQHSFSYDMDWLKALKVVGVMLISIISIPFVLTFLFVLATLEFAWRNFFKVLVLLISLYLILRQF